MSTRRRSPLVAALAVGLAAECGLAAAAAVVVLVGLLTQPPASPAGAVALVILAIIAAVALGAMVLAVLQGRAWVRAAAVVWQLLQLAVGVSALTGAGGQPALGWPLIVLAVVVFLLLFTPPVVAATSARR